jgi:hypothetical protein
MQQLSSFFCPPPSAAPSFYLPIFYPQQYPEHVKFHKYCPSSSGNLALRLCGSSFDTYMYLLVDDFDDSYYSSGSNHLIRQNDDNCQDLGSGIDAQVEAGRTYHIGVGGYSGLYGAYKLDVLGPAADCGDALPAAQALELTPTPAPTYHPCEDGSHGCDTSST